MVLGIRLMLQHVLLFTAVSFAASQFAPDGDPGALNKMKATLVFQEKMKVREEKKEKGLAERAIKRMVQAEKSKMIQEFIDRGSLFLPGEGPTEEDEEPAGEPLKINMNVGEQIIDPRTPQGFGNPFFRQIHVEQAVEVRKLLSEHEEKAIRTAQLPLSPVIRSGWTLIEGVGRMNSLYEFNSEFVMNLMSSPNKIIRRVCNSCHLTNFKEIYYKRLTSTFGRNTLNGWLVGPFGKETQNNPDGDFPDFRLYSTYNDALQDKNPWPRTYPAPYGFPGDASPTSSMSYSHEKQFNGGSGGQPDFAFYVEESAWIPIVGYGKFNMPGYRNGMRIEKTYLSNALQSLHESGNSIIRMICFDCEYGFQDLFYKRITAAPDDLLTILLYNFKQKGGNLLNRDFKIYSSYENALNDTDAWEVCETPEHAMAFPARCKPTSNWTTPVKFFRAKQNNLQSRHDDSTNRHLGFYVEDSHLPETEAWMSESDEMKAFLNPQSTLSKDDAIVCEPDKFDDTMLKLFPLESLFTSSLRPYVKLGVPDSYAGWYDIQGCGKCTDWCGWFAPPGTTTFDGGNPYYESWTESDHVFACVTGDRNPLSNYLRVSGKNSSEYLTSEVDVSIYSEFFDHKYSGWLKFFPSAVTKCNAENEESPASPPYEYVGCFKDDKERALPIRIVPHSEGNTLEKCFNACRRLGKHFFGHQYDRECWCGGENEDFDGYAQYGETGSFEQVEMAEECFPNCVAWESTEPQAYASEDPSIHNSYDVAAGKCSPKVDFSLSSTGCSGCSNYMKSHDSCTIKSQSSTYVGDGEWQLKFSGVVPSAQGGCCTANSCAGGKLTTSSFNFDTQTHAGIEWNFFATGGGDWYEVIVALYRTDDTNHQSPVFSRCFRGDSISSPVTVREPVSVAGKYVLVFYAGSYDKSGGTVLGASINVKFFALYNHESRYLERSRSELTQSKNRKLQSGFKSSACNCEASMVGSYLNCVYQIMNPGVPSISPTLSSTSTSPLINIASRGIASQISNYLNKAGQAWRAIDGNTDGNYFHGSVTHTQCYHANPWFLLHFNKMYRISKILIYNRLGYGQRLIGFVLKIFNGSSMVYDSSIADPSESSTDKPVYNYLIPEVVGDVVRIELYRSECLSLAEVEVMSHEDPNVAPLGTATQMSTALDGVPSKAIDGDLDGDLDSVARTEWAPNQWWQVDLDKRYQISEILVYNTIDTCCNEWNNGFVLKILKNGDVVYDSSVSNPSESSLQKRPHVYMIPYIDGDAVRVEHYNGLILAEVKVLGSISSSYLIHPNVATLGTASQSSTYNLSGNLMYADAAIDGISNPGTANNSVSHTSWEEKPWWQVILDKDYTIFKVDIYSGGNSTRGVVLTILKDENIVYDSSISNPSESTSVKNMYQYYLKGIIGDTVRIHHIKEDFLVLAEVMVFGKVTLTQSPSLMPSQQPSASCGSIIDKVTNDFDFSPNMRPLALSFPNAMIDPFAGYYDVQRCGKCNDWCGWVGPNTDVLPPNPWFKTVTETHYFSCKLAKDYSSTYGMTEMGYFDGTFPYQKCPSKGADTPAYRTEDFVGCFQATSPGSLFPSLIGNGISIPFYDCADTCRDKGFHYFGRQNNGVCRCTGSNVADKSYASEGQISMSDANYCGDCLSDNIGTNKVCVFQLTDQYDPEEERKKHPCSHISLMDVRRYCYVSCRDKGANVANLATCTSLSAYGLVELNNEIAGWADSPLCDTKDCEKGTHPLGNDVKQSKGTF